MVMIRCFCVAIVLGMLGASSAARSETPPAQLVIGRFLSITGPLGTVGVDVRDGMDLAVGQCQAAGGLLHGGKRVPVTVVGGDVQGTDERAGTVIHELLATQKVQVVVGELASRLSLIGAPACQRAGVPMVSPASTDPRVTRVGDNIFRVCYVDSYQGAIMARFAREVLGAKTTGVFLDASSGYSRALGQYYAATFKKLGGEVVHQDAYAATSLDFKSQLAEFAGKPMDVLFIPGYYGQVGQIARQARAAGIECTLLGGDGWDSSHLHELGGEAIVGAFFCTHFHPDDNRPEVQDFVKQFQSRFGRPATGWAALGFDSVRMVLDAASRATTLSSSDLRAALANTKGLAGVTGTIDMDSSRNAHKPASIVEVADNAFKLKMRFGP